MTTIVYRDGILASDSGSWWGEGVLGGAVKIARGQDGTLYGCAGMAAECQTFLDWVENGCQGGMPQPRQVKDDCSSFTALIAVPGKPLEILTAYGRERFYEVPYLAMGSGADFAHGALFMGATAVEAVEVARSFGCGAFGEVRSVRH